MTDKPLDNNENVARAVFSPLMIDENGNLSKKQMDMTSNKLQLIWRNFIQIFT